MSVQSYIKIKPQQKIDFNQVLDDLLNADWDKNDHGSINYCIEEEEDFHWYSKHPNMWKEIKQELLKEHLENKVVGLVLINTLIQSGGTFLFYPNFDISISIDIYRIKIKKSDITDFSKYLETLSCIIEKYYCQLECQFY